jgi:hypothetical protein
MKRIAVLLLLLIVAGGVVFYFGWIQIQIPPDGYGVIFTRTHGWEPEVVRPGTFVWRWQRLIPTNLTLYVFEPGIHRTPIRLEGSLPSGTTINTILEDPGDFDYDIRMTVQTRVMPQSLPELARDRELRPEDLDAFYDDTDAWLSEILTQTVLSIVESDPERFRMDTAYTTLSDAAREALAGNVDYLETVAVAIDRLDLPDMQLYLTARRLAESVLEARAESLRNAARELARSEADSDRELALLERYGEILDRYPVLLDYFRVGQEIEGDPLNIESIIPQSAQ